MPRTMRTDTSRFEIYLPKIVEPAPEARGCEDCTDDAACPNCRAEYWMDNS